MKDEFAPNGFLALAADARSSIANVAHAPSGGPSTVTAKIDSFIKLADLTTEVSQRLSVKQLTEVDQTSMRCYGKKNKRISNCRVEITASF